ncbi:MAG: preprotein translocase subunit SecG [Anaerolineales bacterium]|nr:preprotein translocase subunit SecG [Anaerolineales bacterium]
MESLLDIAIIIVSVALVATIVLQSKQAGLGGIGGAEMTTSFSTRRGLEKTLFRATIVLSVVFFMLAVYTVYVSG